MKLIKANLQYQKQIMEMLKEWKKYNDTCSDNRSPWAIFKNDYDDFNYYIEHLEVKNNVDGLVPSSVFFCLDEDRNIIVGAIDIRHYLNDFLLKYGGHIGYGIRPSERKKGYGTLMLKLALEECRKIKIDKVLIVCEKDNIASAKIIISNKGILENEVIEDNRLLQRYWITL